MKRIYNKVNFKQQKQYIKSHKKIEMKHFDKVSDITNMIDMINKEIEDKSEAKSEGEIHSISQFLARLKTQKTFFIESK